jgi:hypothetical protein
MRSAQGWAACQSQHGGSYQGTLHEMLQWLQRQVLGNIVVPGNRSAGHWKTLAIAILIDYPSGMNIRP